MGHTLRTALASSQPGTGSVPSGVCLGGEGGASPRVIRGARDGPSSLRDDPVAEVARRRVLEDQLVAAVGQDLALDDDLALVASRASIAIRGVDAAAPVAARPAPRRALFAER